MKRDMDLIRQILLSFENTPSERVGSSYFSFDGYTKAQIGFHLEIMTEAGLLDHKIVRPTSLDGRHARLSFDTGVRPTMAGYDFLDSVRDPRIWEKTKKSAEAAGGFTVDLLKDLAKGFLKTLIEEKTGVKLS